MPSARLIAASLCGLPALFSAGANAQDYVQSPRPYYLHPPSSYQEGCWGPCACVLSNREAMRGSFTLDLVSVGDATDLYSITDVDWRVPHLAGQPLNLSLTGSGSFGAGQAPFATHQHMSLSLSLSPARSPWSGVQQFETTPAAGQRSVAPPVIDMEVANSTTGCPGIRLRIVASWYRSDWDGNGSIGVADIFAFLNAWLGGEAVTDFDGNGTVAVADIYEYLNAWFAGT